MNNYTKNRSSKLLSSPLILLALIIPIFLTACSPSINYTEDNNKVITSDREDSPSTSGNNSGTLEVHFIDVGQGDSILLKQGQEYMLVDAGGGDDETTLKDYFTSLGINSFKYVVGTHAHEDHIGSLDYVVENYSVEKVYFPSTTASTKTFENLVLAMQSKNLKFTKPTPGKSFNLGDAKCTILAPNSTEYSNENNYSIVLKVQYGDVSFILTGDAEEGSEKEILSQGFNLEATVLKLGHHGSETSTSEAFLSEINPKYAVVSVGIDNKYDHPKISTMDKLKARSIPVYRTDESGTIVAITDGSDITFNVTPGSYEGMHTSSEKETSKIPIEKVYWTEGGKVYHKNKDCSSLSRSKNILQGSSEECPKDTPCSICN